MVIDLNAVDASLDERHLPALHRTPLINQILVFNLLLFLDK